jgi:glutathione synthase
MLPNAKRIGIVMDPIQTITPKKDSSLAMLLEASRRKFDIFYFEQRDLRLVRGDALGRSRRLSVHDDNDAWFEFGSEQEVTLGELDVILMRKDPPFDMEYVYTTYLLDRAVLAGSLVVNAPQALRDINEKAYTAWFPELTPLTLMTRSLDDLRAFYAEHGNIVVKPLDGMGGRSVFVVRPADNNANVIFETLTENGRRFAMAQVYIPEIRAGDKRILLVDGEPVPYALARIGAARRARADDQQP